MLCSWKFNLHLIYTTTPSTKYQSTTKQGLFNFFFVRKYASIVIMLYLNSHQRIWELKNYLINLNDNEKSYIP